MRPLSGVTSRFCTATSVDAYTSEPGPLVHIPPYDETRRESDDSLRRMMHAAPDAAIPLRRALLTGQGLYLVGKGKFDLFRGQPVRAVYTLQESSGVADVHTLLSACSGVPPHEAHTSRYTRADAGQRDSSLVRLSATLVFAQGEPVAQDTLVRLDAEWYYVRSALISPNGFLVGSADRLPAEALATTAAETRTLNPVTETQAVVSVTILSVLLYWQSLFYAGASDGETPKQDEATLVVAATLATPVGMLFRRPEATWSLQSVTSVSGGVKILKVRRVLA